MNVHITTAARRSSLSIVLVLAALSPGAATQSSQAALRFYGTGTGQQDRVRISIDDNTNGPDASTPCDVGAGSFTVEFWMRGSQANNNTQNGGGDVETADFAWINGNIAVDRDIYGGSERDWGVSIAGGFVRFGTGRGDTGNDLDNTIDGDANVLDNGWHHVAAVRNQITGAKSIYVDGMLDFQSSAGASDADISYPSGGVAGQQTPWGPYIVLAAEKHDAGPSYPSFNGYLDEVRIWSTARSQAEILSTFDRVIPASSTGLVAYYRFEAGSGTSAAGSPAGQVIAGTAGNAIGLSLDGSSSVNGSWRCVRNFASGEPAVLVVTYATAPVRGRRTAGSPTTVTIPYR